MRQVTENWATEAKRRTPVDKGTLRGTVHAEGPFREGTKIITRIVAGGPSAPYAIFVHENLHAHHEVGQAKFIESVILEGLSSFASEVSRRVQLNELNG